MVRSRIVDRDGDSYMYRVRDILGSGLLGAVVHRDSGMGAAGLPWA